jgi:uncharacterized protein YkwD
VLPAPESQRPPRVAQLTVAAGVILAVAAAGLLVTGLFMGRARGADSALTGADVVSTPTESAATLAPSDPASPSTPATTPAAPTTTAPPPPPPATKKATTPAQASGNAGFEATVLTLVNDERAKASCPPLTADSRLTQAARAHSADMATRDYFSHDTPEGVSFATRITNAGYRWSGAAENIAAGQKDPAAVMKSWMDSAGHRANILNCGYKNLGVGLAYNAKKTPYWTQDFGSPR